MSERKTAEIKFRVTPTFKAALQAAAQAADETMSVYIENAVQQRQWGEQKTGVPVNGAGTAVASPANSHPAGTASCGSCGNGGGNHALCRLEVDRVGFLEREGEWLTEHSFVLTHEGQPIAVLKNITEAGGVASDAEAIPAEELPVAHHETMDATRWYPPEMLAAASPQEDVTTSDEVGASEEPQYPWMFRS